MWNYVEAKMPNITLAIDEELLESARQFASRKGTTLNALVRELLSENITQEKKREEARRGLLELMDNSTARMGPDYKWNREATYEERMLPRHKRAALRGLDED
jgi:hypothetical protein